MKNIYVIISHTGTILSRIIRKVTGDQYSHASIGLQEDLDEMYAFGRRNPYTPFPGGFVKESPRYGTLKRFGDTDIAVLKILVSDETFLQITDYITEMYRNRKKYHYNYLGAFFLKFGIFVRRKNYYYCSEFVQDILERFELIPKDQRHGVLRPAELLSLDEGNLIYRGTLNDYVLQHGVGVQA